MDYKYKIGDISRLMHIPVDTLRFYEEKGIIAPKRDLDTNYRYYSVDDVNNLLEYMKYRKFEFSGQDAQEILVQDSLERFISRFKENISKLNYKQWHYQQLCRYQEQYFNKIESIPKFLYRFHIVQSPEMFYVMYRNRNTFAKSTTLQQLMGDWLQHAPFVYQICRIDKENLIDNTLPLDYKYGLGSDAEWVKLLSLDTNAKHVHYLPSRYSVHTVITLQNNVIERQIIDEVLDYIERHNFLVDGNIIGTILGRFHDDTGNIVCYMDMYIPIKE